MYHIQQIIGGENSYGFSRFLLVLRWQSSGSPMQLIVLISIAETKPFTILNSRYSVTNTGSW